MGKKKKLWNCDMNWKHCFDFIHYFPVYKPPHPFHGYLIWYELVICLVFQLLKVNWSWNAGSIPACFPQSIIEFELTSPITFVSIYYVEIHMLSY